jgi:hypothetical protein
MYMIRSRQASPLPCAPLPNPSGRSERPDDAGSPRTKWRRRRHSLKGMARTRQGVLGDRASEPRVGALEANRPRGATVRNRTPCLAGFGRAAGASGAAVMSACQAASQHWLRDQRILSPSFPPTPRSKALQRLAAPVAPREVAAGWHRLVGGRLAKPARPFSCRASYGALTKEQHYDRQHHCADDSYFGKDGQYGSDSLSFIRICHDISLRDDWLMGDSAAPTARRNGRPRHRGEIEDQTDMNGEREGRPCQLPRSQPLTLSGLNYASQDVGN